MANRDPGTDEWITVDTELSEATGSAASQFFDGLAIALGSAPGTYRYDVTVTIEEQRGDSE